MMNEDIKFNYFIQKIINNNVTLMIFKLFMRDWKTIDFSNSMYVIPVIPNLIPVM